MSSIERLIESFKDEKTNKQLLNFCVERAIAMNVNKGLTECDVIRDTMILFAMTKGAMSLMYLY